MNYSRFFDRVLSTIRKHQMLNRGDKVLVAVSGGPDSVALLYFLNQIRPVYDLTLHVFHLNHMIRGREAAEDAQFVVEFANKLGVPSTTMSFDVPALMKRERLSLEEAAREARYELMDRIASEIKADKAALGHHADDQVETFLMRLIRGSGLKGLGSILPVRDHYIRPFIEVSKEEIAEYIDENGLEYRLDASNEDLSILRNKVRRELVPLISSYNPQIRPTLLRTIEVVREDQLHLEELTSGVFDVLAETGEGIVRISIQGLVAQSIALRRRLIRKCIGWVKTDLRGIDFKHIEGILSKIEEVPAQFELELPGDIIVFTEYEYLVFAKRGLFEPAPVEPVRLAVPGVTKIGMLGVEIDARTTDPSNLEFERNGAVAHLDADKIPGELFVRTRRPGDSFKPFGMTKDKKLQDFFVDEKVPKRERDRVPIIASNGDIIWIGGFRIDERFKVTEDTKRVLVLRLKRE